MIIIINMIIIYIIVYKFITYKQLKFALYESIQNPLSLSNNLNCSQLDK